MGMLVTIGGSVLSGIINLVINRAIEKAKDHWVGSKSELRHALQNLQITLSVTKGMVVDAEKRSYYDDDSGIKSWVISLQDATYDADDVLDELEYEQLRKMFQKKNKITRYFHKCDPFKVFEHDIVAKVNEIQERFNHLLQLATYYKLEVVVDRLRSKMDFGSLQGRITTSFESEFNVIGRDSIIRYIVELLTDRKNNSDNQHDMVLSTRKIPIFSIVGMGGIGKTTVAQIVYNHETIKSFFNLVIWVCVSDNFDERNIIKQILESIGYTETKNMDKENETVVKNVNISKGNNENLDILRKTLEDGLKGKRFLLVLDDVWNEDASKWESLNKCFMIDDGNSGSKVLVTTRSEMVANIMSPTNLIELEGLTDEVFWPFFKECAFGNVDKYPSELEEIAKKISNRLKGSPLAVKTVGRILRSDPNKKHWENILNSELWTLRQNENDIMPALKLSYQHLPEYLKPCFAFCSIYPKDHIYKKRDIIYIWIALGYIQNQQGEVSIEETGEQYINDLLDRSMFQSCTKNDLPYSGRLKTLDVERTFKIHDLIHDVAKMVSANESLMIQDECSLKHLSSSTRHVSIFIDPGGLNLHSLNDCISNLRTLIFLTKDTCDVSGPCCVSLQKLLSRMKFLRVLDLSGLLYINKLPPVLPKHLRYLNVRILTPHKLPGSFSHLYQLQVVDGPAEVLTDDSADLPIVVIAYKRGETVPQIKYSVNLRHVFGFHVNMNSIPNLEDFHFLRHIKYDVSKKQKLKGLRCMKHLEYLGLYRLENVKSKEEALEAELKNMGNLATLKLSWGNHSKRSNVEEVLEGLHSGPSSKRGNVEEVLEGLHPGPSVNYLKLSYYPGAACPNWMENMSLLRRLQVEHCPNFKLIGTSGWKMIKYLEFRYCGQLCAQPGCQGFQGLTSLEWLNITSCAQLTVGLFTEGLGGLPSSLKELDLMDWGGSTMNLSGAILQSLTNLARLEIDSYVVPASTKIPEPQQLQQLREFNLTCTSPLQLKGWLLHLHGCRSVKVITLCEAFGSRTSLESFDTEMENALVSFVSLHYLAFRNFGNCRSLPTRLCEISSLKRLRVYSCPKIESLPESRLPMGLQVLDIEYCPLLAENLRIVRHELPDQLLVNIPIPIPNQRPFDFFHVVKKRSRILSSIAGHVAIGNCWNRMKETDA